MRNYHLDASCSTVAVISLETEVSVSPLPVVFRRQQMSSVLLNPFLIAIARDHEVHRLKWDNVPSLPLRVSARSARSVHSALQGIATAEDSMQGSMPPNAFRLAYTAVERKSAVLYTNGRLAFEAAGSRNQSAPSLIVMAEDRPTYVLCTLFWPLCVLC